MFASGKVFTDPDEAAQFVAETGVDWLSGAMGNIHGAISEAAKGKAKPNARLNIEHLARIQAAVKTPLVLHGGTGIAVECVHEAIRSGIAKINIATAIRQPFERAATTSVEAGQRAVYDAMRKLLAKELIASVRYSPNKDMEVRP